MGELCEILKQRGEKEGFSTLADGRGLGGFPHERPVQEAAQRLVLQCVLAMFAEDRGLFYQRICLLAVFQIVWVVEVLMMF